MTDLYLNHPVPGLPSYFNRKAMDELRVLCNRMAKTNPAGQNATDGDGVVAHPIATRSVLEALSKSREYSHIEVGTQAKTLMKEPGWVIVELPAASAADRGLMTRIYNDIEAANGVAQPMIDKHRIAIPTREEATRGWGLRLHIPVHCVDSVVETYGPAPSE